MLDTVIEEMIMTSLIGIIASVAIGTAAAFGAVFAVVGSSGPDDGTAIEQGAEQPVDPGDLINYGQ